MNITVIAAIIGALSAIVGSTITQVANWFLTSQNYKRELEKEYQLNKVNAYVKLFTAISELIYDINTAKKEI
ncbi:hypothetical protein [Peribacillus sp. JNUCC41]|uniref:hypothetical protein n=1 Tax=Peribacillus sp. JNUCC41 TaxID=2778370 RepID=UPI00177D289C|nr:hypothetical protein [Brevibacillus sp. JNUCC-41]QOS88752.1 hypothetical protein JNUCC41_18285 [Brevibacillus sp. JNUCC-41]